MKIYTKKGDKGTTQIIGGTRLPKFHHRIEAYGTVDELISYMGLIRDLLEDEQFTKDIIEIQDRLFTLGSLLAADPKSKMVLPQIFEEDITYLESRIDAMDAVTPPMMHFILPGGSVAVSHMHIARTVCRRAERAIALLAENDEVNPLISAYINRLSDYIFQAARFIVHTRNIEEIKWVPRK